MLRGWVDTPRRLIASFVLLLLLPALAVAWLGMQLLEQDRQLASRQLRERREITAERVVAELERAVSATERRLTGTAPDFRLLPEDDAVLVTLGAAGVEARPENHLLYEPERRNELPEPTTDFAAGEALEFRAHDLEGAIRAYRALAGTTSSPDVRAGALVRLARTLKKAGRAREALAAYDALAQLSAAHVAGLPADLVARRARAVVLEELGYRDELTAAAGILRTDLLARRWRVDRGTFEAYLQQLDDWLGAPPRSRTDREALSDAVDWLFRERRRETFNPAGRHSLRVHERDLTILWQPASDGLTALVAGPHFRQREWIDKLTATLDHRNVAIELVGPNAGVVTAATPQQDGSTLRRSSAETGLPWTIIVTDGQHAPESAGLASQRRTLAAGVALLFVVVSTGAYLMGRSISRELAVARLQSDFVAAVSHEFRTPLTTLHQFTTLLIDDDDLPAKKRRGFYEALARATDRLTHLVESLLDFGRMEAGAHPYRMEPLNAGSLVADVVADFQRDPGLEGFTVECRVNANAGSIVADREAIRRAIRNLLDNAVKYSGAGRRIEALVERRGTSVAISVCDQGLGIPRDEQRQIFNKFVRGSASLVRGIKGTGIGLAMVRHIVTAHGGRVTLDSETGRGSACSRSGSRPRSSLTRRT